MDYLDRKVKFRDEYFNMSPLVDSYSYKILLHTLKGSDKQKFTDIVNLAFACGFDGGEIFAHKIQQQHG